MLIKLWTLRHFPAITNRMRGAAPGATHSCVARLSPLLRLWVGDDHVAGFLGDHVHGAQDEQPGDFGKHRGIDNAQTGDAAHPEPAVEYGGRIIVGADLARAAGVMTPGAVLDELPHFGPRPALRARDFLVEKTGGALRDPSHELHPGRDRVEVVAARVVALVEIHEIDVRRLARIG